MKQSIKLTNLFGQPFAVDNQHPSNNVLKTQKVYNRPDVAASFLGFLFQKIQKDIACSGTGGVL